MPTTALHRYEQLADELAQLIRQGVLRPGERLPSVRQLTQEKRLSASTVVQALRQLEEQGLVEARPQSGFFVRRRVQGGLVAKSSSALPEAGAVSGIQQAVPVTLNANLLRVVKSCTQPGVVPLGAALPAAELLPVAAIHRLYGKVVRQYPHLLDGSNYFAMNHPALVRQLVRRSISWGGPLAAEEIVITHSCTEALSLCLRTVTRPGDTVAVESPGYYLMLQLLENLGLKALEIPTTADQGISVEALELATREQSPERRISACLFVPNASNPLGSIMPDTRKAQLAALLAERRIPLIEDDIYGDLHFDAQRPWPIKAFDRSGNVLLCSSFSKSITPGLRIGFIAGGRFAQQLALQKTVNSGACNPVSQCVLAEYLESGAYDRHLRRLRLNYARQADALVQCVRANFPSGTRVLSPHGGFVVWVELPAGIDAMQLYELAIAEQIAFIPGSLFSPSGRYRNCLRLNAGYPWSAVLEQAVIRLGQLAGHLQSGAYGGS
jgi:DNA-binding transcriptional MocR family regulator